MEYARASTDRRLFTTGPAVGWIAVERGLDSRETPLSAIVSRANDPGECADQSRFPRFRQGFIRASRRSRRRSTKKKLESSLFLSLVLLRPPRRRENSFGFRARESSQFLSFLAEKERERERKREEGAGEKREKVEGRIRERDSRRIGV